MSRAFVRESEGDEAVARRWGAALPAGTPNLVTPAGAARLNEILRGWQRERDALAGTEGFDAGRKAALDAEIRALEPYLRTLRVTECPADPARVVFGATAEVEMDGERREITIVGVDEADPPAGRVSFVSPLARALQGAAAGDTVTFRTPKGDVEVEVLQIRRRDDRAPGGHPG